MTEAKANPREQLALFYRAGFKSNGAAWERRLYKKLWARIRRLDPEFRRKESRRMRKRRNQRGEKAAQARRNARWVRRNRGRLRAYNHGYWVKYRARRCGFCNRRAGRGRHSLRPVRGILACPGCFA